MPHSWACGNARDVRRVTDTRRTRACRRRRPAIFPLAARRGAVYVRSSPRPTRRLQECPPMAVQMELHKIIVNELQDHQVIFLKEVDGERTFPIVIGSTEANAINRRLKGEQSARPMTHDLLANVIEQMGGRIDRIEITHLQDHTFYAAIHIKKDGDEIEVDSRPSDAIALGIANMVPIFVAESVLNEVC
jgi:bifunctional DNase/RNase